MIQQACQVLPTYLSASDYWMPAFAGMTAIIQCTLTASSSWLQALASAASRVSVSMIGVPSAPCSANSLMPGAIFGACGNRLATSSEWIALT